MHLKNREIEGEERRKRHGSDIFACKQEELACNVVVNIQTGSAKYATAFRNNKITSILDRIQTRRREKLLHLHGSSRGKAGFKKQFRHVLVQANHINVILVYI